MSQIDEVRSKTDIVELINEYVPLKKRGRNFQALCPFHSEKQPSFNVSPELQIFKCFGCGAGGDVFKFLMEYEKMDFGEALRFLADRTGIKLKRYRPSPQEAKKKILLEINHLASEYYHYLLTHHPVGQAARDYLKKRGVNQKSIKLFKLGYAPQMWDGLLKFLVGKKKYPSADVESAGLIIKRNTQYAIRNTTKPISSPVLRISGYYDRFRARLMFPLFDHRDNVQGFSGRTLQKDLQGAKYINTPETLLYHKGDLLFGLNIAKNQVKKANQAILVEGEFDALSSYQAGLQNTVAIKGSALTAPQARLIRRFTENVVFALDADAAGDEAIRRGITIAEEYDLNIQVAIPLYGKDPDDCVKHSPSLWHQSIKKAQNIYDFYLDSTLKRFNVQTPEGLKKISQEILPILSQIKNQIVQNHYLKKFAQKTGVSEEAILAESQRLQFPLASETPTKVSVKAGPKKSRRQLLEEYLFSLTLKNENPQALIKEFKSVKIKSPALAQISAKLHRFLSSHRKFSIKKFVNQLPAELQEAASHLYLQKEAPAKKDEVSQLFLQLQQMTIKETLQNLAKKITLAENQKDEKTLLSYQKKYNLHLAKLKKLSAQSPKS